MKIYDVNYYISIRHLANQRELTCYTGNTCRLRQDVWYKKHVQLGRNESALHSVLST